MLNQLHQVGLLAVMAWIGLVGPSPAWSQVKNWNTAAGSWNAAGNWSPVGLPGPADSVFIGNTVLAENATVNQNVATNIANLTVTDGMTLDTNGNSLVVFGAASVSGQNIVDNIAYSSRIKVENGPNATDALFGSASTSSGGVFELDESTALIQGTLTSGLGGIIRGTGTILLTGNAPTIFHHDGFIDTNVGTLHINSTGTGRIDLDGAVLNDNYLNVTKGTIDGSNYAKLTLTAVGLTDPMDENVWIGGGNVLTMNFDEAWTLSSIATLSLFTDPGPGNNPARLVGSELILHGDVTMPGSGVYGLLQCPVTIQPSSLITIGPGDFLQFSSTVIINGGTFDLTAIGADVDFDGPTLIKGGTFTTASTNWSQGSVDLDGPTEYDGTVTFNGNARQTGNVIITGPTVINAGTFDMDGGAGAFSTWGISNACTINATSIESTPGDLGYDGTLNLTGTFLGRLTVNILTPQPSWRMEGTMNLGGVAAIEITRLEGSGVLITGLTTIVNRVRITAPCSFDAGSDLVFINDTSRVRFTAPTALSAGMGISGGGRIESAPGGMLILGDGVDFTTTDLLSAGVLDIGNFPNDPGQASVDVVTFEPTSHWEVDIGGYDSGLTHDWLSVAKVGNTLGGTMAIDLVDLGNGIFEPQLSDSFILLSAPGGGLSGAFANQPFTHIPGKGYQWELSYPDTRLGHLVVAKVAGIIPCPADLNGDGVVDGADLGLLLAAWGRCPQLGTCLADLSNDNTVDGADLGILLAAWGPCPLN